MQEIDYEIFIYFFVFLSGRNSYTEFKLKSEYWNSKQNIFCLEHYLFTKTISRFFRHLILVVQISTISFLM